MLYRKLTLETRLKYLISLVGLALSFGLLIADDLGYIKSKSPDFYKVIIGACAASFKIINPKYTESTTTTTTPAKPGPPPYGSPESEVLANPSEETTPNA